MKKIVNVLNGIRFHWFCINSYICVRYKRVGFYGKLVCHLFWIVNMSVESVLYIMCLFSEKWKYLYRDTFIFVSCVSFHSLIPEIYLVHWWVRIYNSEEFRTCIKGKKSCSKFEYMYDDWSISFCFPLTIKVFLF